MHTFFDGGDDNQDSGSIHPNPDDKGGAAAGMYGSEDPANLPIPGVGEGGVGNSDQ